MVTFGPWLAPAWRHTPPDGAPLCLSLLLLASPLPRTPLSPLKTRTPDLDLLHAPKDDTADFNTRVSGSLSAQCARLLTFSSTWKTPFLGFPWNLVLRGVQLSKSWISAWWFLTVAYSSSFPTSLLIYIDLLKTSEKPLELHVVCAQF